MNFLFHKSCIHIYEVFPRKSICSDPNAFEYLQRAYEIKNECEKQALLNKIKRSGRNLKKFLDRQYKDPDKLNDLFIQITDDLSYSRTFYPNRSVRVYLNSLAQRVFFSIYKNRKSKAGRFVAFWKDELPQLMYEARKDLTLAFVLFLFACGIGVLSSMMDPEFAQIILGESYVDMTLENIESGDPMAVYKARGELGMSLYITGNNIRVAILTLCWVFSFELAAWPFSSRMGSCWAVFSTFLLKKAYFKSLF